MSSGKHLPVGLLFTLLPTPHFPCLVQHEGSYIDKRSSASSGKVTAKPGPEYQGFVRTLRKQLRAQYSLSGITQCFPHLANPLLPSLSHWRAGVACLEDEFNTAEISSQVVSNNTVGEVYFNHNCLHFFSTLVTQLLHNMS